MVVAVCAAVPLPGCGGAPEFRIEGPGGITGGGYLRGVDVQEGEPVHVHRPDVSDGGNKLAGQFTLDDEVPGLDVPASHRLVRHWISHLARPRQGEPPLADVRAADR